jgi:hypothetical protein
LRPEGLDEFKNSPHRVSNPRPSQLNYGLVGQEICVRFSSVTRPALGLSRFTVMSNEWEKFVSEVKLEGREANHSLPSSAEIKNGGSFTYAFLIRHNNTFR